MSSANWNGRADDTGELSWALCFECLFLLTILAIVVLA
jgi:hypothetical protein